MEKKDDNMTKLYPVEDIDAYIARKPSPEYDEFMRKQKQKEKKKEKEEQDHDDKM